MKGAIHIQAGIFAHHNAIRVDQVQVRITGGAFDLAINPAIVRTGHSTDDVLRVGCCLKVSNLAGLNVKFAKAVQQVATLGSTTCD